MKTKPPLIIPSVGRMVHCTLPLDHRNAGQHRSAVIVGVHSNRDEPVGTDTLVSLQVFMDPFQDGPDSPLTLYVLPVRQDNAEMLPKTWHAPEPVAQPST